MSVVKINAIAVPEGAGAELEARFAARARSVEQMPGFEDFQLLRPVEGEDALLRLHPLGQRGVVPGLGHEPGLPARPRQGRVVRRQAGGDRLAPARLRGRPARARSACAEDRIARRRYGPPVGSRCRGPDRPEVRRHVRRRPRSHAGGRRERRVHEAPRPRRRGRRVGDGQGDRQPDRPRRAGVEHPPGPGDGHAADDR